MLNTRYLSSLAALTFIGLTGVTGSAIAAGPSSQFDLNGDVVTPGFDTLSSLSALPATTETATYKAGGGAVRDAYTGTALWTLLGSAGGIKPIPGVKNSSLLNYVVAVGSDGYEAVFSGGELNPMFGGSSSAPDLVAYSDTGGQLGPGGADGFARMVVPGDTAGGRYVSNLVDLTVGQARVPAKGPGGLSTQFTLSGVQNPDAYTLSSLAALPAVQLTATYKAGGTPVTDTSTRIQTANLARMARTDLRGSSCRATPRGDAISPTWSRLRSSPRRPFRSPRPGCCSLGRCPSWRSCGAAGASWRAGRRRNDRVSRADTGSE
jgi:hypothetical protein